MLSSPHPFPFWFVPIFSFLFFLFFSNPLSILAWVSSVQFWIPLGFALIRYVVSRQYVSFDSLCLLCARIFLFVSLHLHEWECFLVQFHYLCYIHLSQATVDSIMRDKMPKKGGRWWFSWRGRNSSIKEVSLGNRCAAFSFQNQKASIISKKKN